MPATTRIPALWWFTYKRDLLAESPIPAFSQVESLLAANLANTLHVHPGVRGTCLDNWQCIDIIRQAEVSIWGSSAGLARAFQRETDGSFRGDICRAAVLWLHGGFYSDVDTVSTHDWRSVLAGTTFSTATAKGGWLFNAVMAATPRHPVLRWYMQGLASFYAGNRSVPAGADTISGMRDATAHTRYARYPGDMLYAAVAAAARTASTRATHTWSLLTEMQLPEANDLLRAAGKPKTPKQLGKNFAKDCCCNFVVVDPSTPAVLFYSRLPGVSPMCDSAAATGGAGDYKQRRSRLDSSLVQRHEKAKSYAGTCTPNSVRKMASSKLGRGMQDVLRLLALLALGKPFCFVHFNDGEIESIKQVKGSIDHGWQALSPRLSTAMLAALKASHPQLFLGLPCAREFGGTCRRDAIKMLEHTRGRTQRTSAVIFINGNYELTRPLLPKLLSRRASRGARVHLVVSQNASVDAFCASTSVPVASVVRVPSVNAFPSAYEAHRGGWTRYRTGDIVLLLCGPLGRLLAVEWFLQQPSATFLELGSFFDPELHSGKSLGLKWGAQAFYHGRKWRPECEQRGDVQANRTLFRSIEPCLLQAALEWQNPRDGGG